MHLPRVPCRISLWNQLYTPLWPGRGTKGASMRQGGRLPGGWPARKVAPHRLNPTGPPASPTTHLAAPGGRVSHGFLPTPSQSALGSSSCSPLPPRCAFRSLLHRYPQALVQASDPQYWHLPEDPLADQPPGQSLHVCPKPSPVWLYLALCPCPHFSRSALPALRPV